LKKGNFDTALEFILALNSRDHRLAEDETTVQSASNKYTSTLLKITIAEDQLLATETGATLKK
jgi:hypothetical protein